MEVPIRYASYGKEQARAKMIVSIISDLGQMI